MPEKQAENCISSAVLDKLIAAHDGDVALLWLYRQRTGALDEEQAAQALCRTLQEIRAAEEKLRRMELLPEGGVLLSDNVLKEGEILESKFSVTRRNRTIHKRMREYLAAVSQDPRLRTILLETGDGAALSVRRRNVEDNIEAGDLR